MVALTCLCRLYGHIPQLADADAGRAQRFHDERQSLLPAVFRCSQQAVRTPRGLVLWRYLETAAAVAFKSFR